MQPLMLVDVVGLTPRQIGEKTPVLRELSRSGAFAPMGTVLPAVTCSVQATWLTGTLPDQHGAVGNGWCERESRDIALWRQANALVHGRKFYELAKERDPRFTCAKLFWWWNLGAAVDWSITPRPFYPADGRKIPAIYAWPTSFGEQIESRLGPFPFFDFWGPKSGLPSSEWIAAAAIEALRDRKPTLTMVYLPHLDYDQQRFGPEHEQSQVALTEIDGVVGKLRRAAEDAGAALMIVSEYGLEYVDTPIDVNRALRRAGLLQVRDTPAGEVLDVFASRAWAVADHQVAHVYAADRAALDSARSVCRSLGGVEEMLEGPSRREAGLDHARAGDLVLVARPGAWFTYYYWLDDGTAPDFARTVDIHRKVGYDPCELFVDPELTFPKLRVARRLLQKKLGMRYLMDVIPLDAKLVRGSHGRLPARPDQGPVFLCTRPFARCGGEPAGGVVDPRSLGERVLEVIFGERR